MTRVKLVTEEMRQNAEFAAAGRDIDAVIARGRGAKGRVIRLMKELLKHPSRRTVGYFAEIQERWGSLVDALNFLERRWSKWVTFSDALELIAHKYKDDPVTTDIIDLVATETLEIALATSTLGLGYRVRVLVQTILERCRDNDRLSHDLINLLEWSAYSRLTNIQSCVKRFISERQKASSPDQRTHV
jgi:hypothetical protein